jgi:hypothetical protein
LQGSELVPARHECLWDLKLPTLRLLDEFIWLHWAHP